MKTTLIVIAVIFVACFIAFLWVTHNAVEYNPAWDDDDDIVKH